jgi:hypothetical protein
MFILYINGIFNLKLSGSVQAYADDIAIVYSENSTASLKASIMNDSEKIHVFLKAHSLDINISKTKYILFHGRTNFEYFTQQNLAITIEGQTIERISDFRYLGLIIDEELNFKTHIQYITKKIVPIIYALKRITRFINQKTLYSLYYAHIYNHLVFMNPLWSVAGNDSLERLFVLQKKALKIIQHKHILAPSHTLFSENILPLPVVMDYHLLVMAFKIKNGMIKNNTVIQYVSDIHTYGTRQRGDFYIFTHETRYGYADFYKRGLIKFNELPSSLKGFHSLPIFKSRLREYLYDCYQA